MGHDRVTLKDIAAALGLSVPTVSMALRGHREIAAVTSERVKAKAAEMRYQPDPAMRALADYRTRQRSTSSRWNRVALLHDWPSVEAWRTHYFYGGWRAQLEAVAAERGVVIEEHWLGGGGEHAKAVFRILRHRSITGLLLAPPGLTGDPVEISVPPGHSFQVVTFGPEHLYRQFHTVQFDYYENLRLAWSKLWEKGHRRIGLLHRKLQGWRTGQAWRAAFHIEKLEAGWKPGEMMPLMLDGANEAEDRTAYLDWLRHDQYDAVISSIYEVEEWNRSIARPPAVAFFNVLRAEQQGIDINVGQLIRSAFELLCVEMQQTLVERHDLPFRVHIPGRWVDAGEAEVMATG
jgi:DNA-binding LacI/PurR family transcriptional regulator